MIKEIVSFMAERQIECYSSIPFSACRVTNAGLLERSIKKPQSVLMLLFPYYDGDRDDRNVSLYAVPRDYHGFAKVFFASLCGMLEKSYPGHHFAGFSDHSPFDEREAAVRAGLGVFGDNGLLINSVYGSYVFLGELVSDMRLDENETVHEFKGCRHCGACKKACPMKGECLSMVTQLKGDLTEVQKELILENNTVWGCDLCQTACPCNRDVKHTPIPYFREQKIYHLTRPLLDAMSDEEFSKRAFSWRKRKTIERNLLLMYPDPADNDCGK